MQSTTVRHLLTAACYETRKLSERNYNPDEY